ncbi:YbhB/YbcL family Raf kinase inhibitor-like protein [Actinoallomurus liliacearum]|uniref:YbhB/YbcL family Raf kinase inhibitor-like protein n=1 Tax=Actinoallomurus liliacearum TaxID=1080073 RepID=A0ABP8TZI6_9ACTN
MTKSGELPKRRRAGHAGLAWNSPNLAGEQTLALSSPDFGNEGAIPAVHASTRVGGEDLSPALTWSSAPGGTAQLLLVVEDPDAPTPMPFVHCVALLDPSVTGLAHGALGAGSPSDGVRVLRSGIGSGYFGPAPPKSHGPHRYVFQLFALATPVTTSSSRALESAKPRDVLAAAGDVLARGRLDGFYQRT